MSLWSWVKGKRGASGFGYASTAEEVTAGLDLSGKTIVVTGVNSGLGLESARVLSSRGAHIVGLARTTAKAEEALAALGKETTPVACELSEPSSIRAAVATVEATKRPIDVLLCNAGIMALPRLEQKLGYELQFFTNHVGHFLLVMGLRDRLADEGKVVMLSSAAHQMTYREGIQLANLSGERGYNPWRAYGQSKLANLLFARALAKRFEGSGRTATAVHPGAIATNLGRHMAPWLQTVVTGVAGLLVLKDVHQGAATQCYAAVHPDAAGLNGEYFEDCNVSKSSKHGRSAELAEKLWAASEEIADALEG